MGLEFTTIKDAPGAAIYFISDGTEADGKIFSQLAADVSSRSKLQCIVLNVKDKNAGAILDFYDLKGTHFVIIVRDNDELHHVWSDGERFDVGQIVYFAEQAG